MAHIRRTLKKMSAPGMIAVRFCSSICASKQRFTGHAWRLCLWPLPFLSSLLSLALLVQTCTLPIPVAFLLISADVAAVTEGCETKTCCTPLCYVDEQGNHHCVHKHSDSCGHGKSTDESGSCPVLIMTLALAPEPENLLPSLDPIGLIVPKQALQTTRYPSMPTPPPK
jgi:hypothetical protein